MKINIWFFLRGFILFSGALFLLSCNPEPAAVQSSVSSSEAVVEFDDGGETVEILTTHWINESDIGDGKGPVTDALLRAPQDEAGDSWIQFGGDYTNRRHSPIETLSPEILMT